jgi:2-amino-4-hydroxy-6-hydroxymethyldihydropteridine diphosphokinase
MERLRPSHRAVIAFGANLGDRAATIRAAADELDAVPGVHVRVLSPLVESAAVTLSGVDADVPEYLNAVALVDTALDPYALLDRLHAIEDAHGRVREERWGSRTLDLDIVDYDGRVLEDDRLTLPHPRAAERAFVLAPWHAVDASAELPGRGSVVDLLAPLAGTVRAHLPATGADGESTT